MASTSAVTSTNETEKPADTTQNNVVESVPSIGRRSSSDRPSRKKINRLLTERYRLKKKLRELEDREINFGDYGAEDEGLKQESKIEKTLIAIESRLFKFGILNSGLDDETRALLNGSKMLDVIITDSGNQLLNDRLTEAIAKKEATNKGFGAFLDLEELRTILRSVYEECLKNNQSSNIPSPDSDKWDRFVSATATMVSKAVRAARVSRCENAWEQYVPLDNVNDVEHPPNLESGLSEKCEVKPMEEMALKMTASQELNPDIGVGPTDQEAEIDLDLISEKDSEEDSEDSEDLLEDEDDIDDMISTDEGGKEKVSGNEDSDIEIIDYVKTGDTTIASNSPSKQSKILDKNKTAAIIECIKAEDTVIVSKSPTKQSDCIDVAHVENIPDKNETPSAAIIEIIKAEDTVIARSPSKQSESNAVSHIENIPDKNETPAAAIIDSIKSEDNTIVSKSPSKQSEPNDVAHIENVLAKNETPTAENLLIDDEDMQLAKLIAAKDYGRDDVDLAILEEISSSPKKVKFVDKTVLNTSTRSVKLASNIAEECTITASARSNVAEKENECASADIVQIDDTKEHEPSLVGESERENGRPVCAVETPSTSLLLSDNENSITDAVVPSCGAEKEKLLQCNKVEEDCHDSSRISSDVPIEEDCHNGQIIGAAPTEENIASIVQDTVTTQKLSQETIVVGDDDDIVELVDLPNAAPNAFVKNDEDDLVDVDNLAPTSTPAPIDVDEEGSDVIYAPIRVQNSGDDTDDEVEVIFEKVEQYDKVVDVIDTKANQAVSEWLTRYSVSGVPVETVDLDEDDNEDTLVEQQRLKYGGSASVLSDTISETGRVTTPGSPEVDVLTSGAGDGDDDAPAVKRARLEEPTSSSVVHLNDAEKEKDNGSNGSQEFITLDD